MPASVACCAASLEQSSGTESGKEQAIFLPWLRGRGYVKGKVHTNKDANKLRQTKTGFFGLGCF